MTKVLAAFGDGWSRVLRAPAILLGVFVATACIAFPAVRATGPFAGTGAFDDVLWGPVSGFWPSYTPTLLGTERFLRDTRTVIALVEPRAAWLAATATTIVVWTFLLGGILDRYARRRPIRAQAFFGASGVFFFRFLRLGVVAAAGYWLLFGVAHPLLFPPDYPYVSGESSAAAASPLRSSIWAVFLMAATFWDAVVDYARIRAVVEDRRSMLGAVLAGWRFVVRHPMKAGGLYVVNAAAFGVLLGVYALVFPFTPEAGAAGPAALAAANLFLLGRLAFKLAFFASQTALFQRSVAHADYTATPPMLWPESPAAETAPPRELALSVQDLTGLDGLRPVSGGVPLAAGAASRGAAFVLTDEQGETVPCQSHVLTRWKDGSARWVLLDFQAAPPPAGTGHHGSRTNPTQAR
mgnify:CR=1 FL=1